MQILAEKTQDGFKAATLSFQGNAVTLQGHYLGVKDSAKAAVICHSYKPYNLEGTVSALPE